MYVATSFASSPVSLSLPSFCLFIVFLPSLCCLLAPSCVVIRAVDYWVTVLPEAHAAPPEWKHQQIDGVLGFTKLTSESKGQIFSFLLVSNEITCTVLYLNLFQRPSIRSVLISSPGTLLCQWQPCVFLCWAVLYPASQRNSKHSNFS